MKRVLLFVLLSSSINSFGQPLQNSDSAQKLYYSRLKVLSDEFSSYYYPNRPKIYSLSEKNFLKIIDSLKSLFHGEVIKYKISSQTPDAKFIADESRDIEYFFDRMIQDYPYFHENHTGKKVTLSRTVQKKLDKHLADFNNPALLTSRDFKGYVESFLRHKSSIEVKKAVYKT